MVLWWSVFGLKSLENVYCLFSSQCRKELPKGAGDFKIDPYGFMYPGEVSQNFTKYVF